MSSHHSDQMSQRSQVSKIALWRCPLNVIVIVIVIVIAFVFVFVFVFVFAFVFDYVFVTISLSAGRPLSLTSVRRNMVTAPPSGTLPCNLN